VYKRIDHARNNVIYLCVVTQPRRNYQSESYMKLTKTSNLMNKTKSPIRYSKALLNSTSWRLSCSQATRCSFRIVIKKFTVAI